MSAGFSARGLDTKYVTPFLKAKNFPYMKSGSGALTRSLEQSVPYDLEYTGHIIPKELRKAFLHCLDQIETDKINPRIPLIYIFQKLIDKRDRDESIQLIKPSNLSIKDIVVKLQQHFEMCSKSSQLPVLAVYAVYAVLIQEMRRYKSCVLCDLQSHQSPDSRSHFLGDIQINNKENDTPFEVVEIRHGIELTPELVNVCYDKFKSSSVNTYYLLSTREEFKDPEEISKRIMFIYKTHGCQMIVNGVFNTLKYYLRLLSEPNKFLYKYLELVEQESNYAIKMNWQKIWEATDSKSYTARME